jgi:catechol 2,3-dioxygenase-like lactoylglutathione lyase family enzyme
MRPLSIFRWLTTAAIVVCACVAGSARAQLAAPNTAGVAMGHVHYVVEDVVANRDFWVSLGGNAAPYARGEIVRFPGVMILLSQGAAEGGSEGSVVNHVAFRVASLAPFAEKGIALRTTPQYPGIASVLSPEGERIELFDDQVATNIGFELAPGVDDPVAERHNEPLAAPVVTHHVHFYLPEDQVLAARDWYVRHFGATPGKRWRYDAADLPGMNLNFSAAAEPQVPTRGRMLDHIGFEVVGLEAFCAKLEASGIVFDQPFRRLPTGLALAFLTDPWGTYIELTEGLEDL